MAPPFALLLVSAPLLALLPHAQASQALPTAIKKPSPDAGHKILAEDLAFLNDEDFSQSPLTVRNDTALLLPAFKRHVNEVGAAHPLRRAAEVLSILSKRASCPAGMNSCIAQGAPNKCCQEGTYCTEVSDALVGHVACCPRGVQCGGQVGSCPDDAVTCPADLGGGCCISGYVCRGSGCVPSGAATVPSPTESSSPLPVETVTSTRATSIDGSSSTGVVTETISRTSSPPATTTSTTETASPSGTEPVAGIPPWRPTESSTSSAPASGPTSTDTQEGCPTGFYGCLATHGGGCCRTDRDCQTHSCPAPAPRTTVVSNGETVVVPVPTGSRAADGSASSTCAGGWFLCGKSAGPEAGCCPSGYECGTASCFAQASQTGSVQKERPRQSSGHREGISGQVALLQAAAWAFFYSCTVMR